MATIDIIALVGAAFGLMLLLATIIAVAFVRIVKARWDAQDYERRMKQFGGYHSGGRWNVY